MELIRQHRTSGRGQLIRWVDLTVNEKSPFFSLTLAPAALDFEKGDVALVEEVPAVPGKEGNWRAR